LEHLYCRCAGVHNQSSPFRISKSGAHGNQNTDFFNFWYKVGSTRSDHPRCEKRLLADRWLPQPRYVPHHSSLLKVRTYHWNQPNANHNGSIEVLTPEAAGDDFLNGDGDDKAHAINKRISSEQDTADKTALNGTHTVFQCLATDANNFRETAKSFLAAHREEISQRDNQIQELRAELLRIQEASKVQESVGENADVQEIHVKEAAEEQPGSDIGESQNPPNIGEDTALDSVQRPSESAVELDCLVQDDPNKV